MKRILALHGHSQSAHIFSRKVAVFIHPTNFKLTFWYKVDFLCQALKDEVEFVFLDAPHILVPVDPQNPYDITISSTATVDKHTPRCWWKYLYSTYDDWAVIESLLHVKNVLEKEGPFNGILGFSQGGALATLVAGLLEYTTYNPYFSNVNHPPFEFVICLSGFLIPSENFAAPPGMRTPALLVQGECDTLVLPEWTKYLYDRFDKEIGDVKLEMHEGGHFVPRKPRWKSFLSKYIRDLSSRPTPAWSVYRKISASSSTDSLVSYYSSAASSLGTNDASSDTSFSDIGSGRKDNDTAISSHPDGPFEGDSGFSSPCFISSRPDTPDKHHEPLSALDSPTISAALASTSLHKPITLHELENIVLQSAYNNATESAVFDIDIERGFMLDSDSDHSSIDIPGIANRKRQTQPKLVKRIPSAYLRSAEFAML